MPNNNKYNPSSISGQQSIKMPPRPSRSQQHAPARRKKTPKAPETADEYLAVGVEFEESGERWRSGDVAKAGRFFTQAIAAYEATVQRYPQTFDARYNRGSTYTARLEAAASAHAECHELEPNSSDVLFNYGQVLTSLAEAYQGNAEDDGGNPAANLAARCERAKQTLETSFGCFQKCLQIQEKEYKSTLAEAAVWENLKDGSTVPNNEEVDMEEGGVTLSADDISGANTRRSSVSSTQSSSGSSSSNTQWAAIVEPTTIDTLLDTAQAQLDVLTSILSLGSSPVNSPVPDLPHALFTTEYLSNLSASAEAILNDYIVPLSSTLPDDRCTEALISRANYLVSQAEIKSHFQEACSTEDWESVIKTSFAAYTYPPTSTDDATAVPSGRLVDFTPASWQALCDRSTAYTTLSTTVFTTFPESAWKYGTLAANDLAAAVKLAPEKSKPEVYLARGNLELLRSRIRVDAAAKARAVLRKNAGVYYRGVVSLIKAGGNLMGVAATEEGRIKEVADEAKVKEGLLRFEDGDSGAMKGLVKDGLTARNIRLLVSGAVEEGLFDNTILALL